MATTFGLDIDLEVELTEFLDSALCTLSEFLHSICIRFSITVR